MGLARRAWVECFSARGAAARAAGAVLLAGVAGVIGRVVREGVEHPDPAVLSVATAVLAVVLAGLLVRGSLAASRRLAAGEPGTSPDRAAVAGYVLVATLALPFLPVARQFIGGFNPFYGFASLGWLFAVSVPWLLLTLTVTPRLARGRSLRGALGAHLDLLAADPWLVVRGTFVVVAAHGVPLLLAVVAWLCLVIAGATWFLVVTLLVFGLLGLVLFLGVLVCAPLSFAYTRAVKETVAFG